MSISDFKARLTAEEHKLLVSLRERKPARHPPSEGEPVFGERLADAVASNVGSWTFIAIQSVLLCLWIVANSVAWFMQWDPYPFHPAQPCPVVPGGVHRPDHHDEPEPSEHDRPAQRAA